MKFKKPNLLTAICVGTIFSVSFLTLGKISSVLFLKQFPSRFEDDVRFDLVLPVLVTTYIASLVVSYLSAKLLAIFIKRKRVFKTHAYFSVLMPVLAIAAYFVIAFIFLIFLWIDFYNESIDGVVISIVGFVAAIFAYRWALSLK